MNVNALTLDDFFDAWELFRAASLSGALAGALLGYLGVYVVLRRMVFLSAALSQAAGLGVVLAFWASIMAGEAAWAWLASPVLGAIVTTSLATVLVVSAGDSRRDSVLGLVYLVGAAGALVVGTRITHELHDITSVLFGSAVAVLSEEYVTLLVMTAVLATLHIWWRRGFELASFDREGAQVRGLPVRLLDLLLLGSLALAISVCTRVLGALPVFAFSVLPAMAAVRMVPNVRGALWLAAWIGAASGYLGYIAAFMYKLPVGASQALVAAVPAILSEGYRTVRRQR